MRHLSRALAVAIIAMTSLPSTVLAQAPGGNVVTKRWRDGNTLRRHLLKNPRYQRHLLSIGRLASRKKPGIALICEIGKLAAIRPKKERSRLAWGIVAEICIKRGLALCRQWDQAPQAKQQDVQEIIVILQEIRRWVEKNMAAKKAVQACKERTMKQMQAGLEKIMEALDTAIKTDKELTP